jgi:hypothetical protein
MTLRRTARGIAAALLLGALIGGVPAVAMNIQSRYSPRNGERDLRPHTWYIILHTTEAPEKSSLNKLRANGEAHYLVGTDGAIYRIVSKRRVAYHAGVSMWNGRTNIDNYSIGIEVVGYHNREINDAQYAALRELLDELQRIYSIPDHHVLTHSMVAYGHPNKWHKRPHRGRKRCGMNFADERARRRLGLKRGVAYDPDVRAGRLAVGDEELFAKLYGGRTAGRKLYAAIEAGRNIITTHASAWDIAGSEYNKPTTHYVFPDGRAFSGDRIRDWSSIPAGTKIVLAENPVRRKKREAILAKVESTQGEGLAGLRVIGKHGSNAKKVAGEQYNQESTIYFLPDGRVRCGHELSEKELKRIPNQTAVLIGYTYGGHITDRKSAYDICSERWNNRETYYRFTDGRIMAGHHIDENSLPPNTLVFFRN